MRHFFLLMLFGVLAKAGRTQMLFNGNITEPEWGAPLTTAMGGPAPCVAGLRLNSLFASADNTHLFFALGGNIQGNNAIVLFIDSKPGGFNNCDFGREGTIPNLQKLHPGIVFDEGFYPDYCLTIHADPNKTEYFFNLLSLGGTAAAGGGINTYLGSNLVNMAAIMGVNAAENDNTKGFELGIPRQSLAFNAAAQQEVRLMAMTVSEAGQLDNQFVSPAATGEGCYGGGPVDFRQHAPNPVSYSPDQLLPISFTQFNFIQRGNAIVLQWASASETNMQAYELQRSSDAITFNGIGLVAAKGNTSSVSKYDFPDAQPNFGKNFYRVKAIDKAGRTAYSPVVKVQFGYVDNSLGIFPNPVSTHINLQLIGITKGKYSLVIYNDAGQRMMARTIEYNGGYGLQQIPVLPNMTAGPYRLLLTNKSVFYKQNFVVRK